MIVLEIIPDLTLDKRAVPFWRACRDLLHTGALLNDLDLPRPSPDYRVEWNEVVRMFKWIDRFRREPFNPEPGDEIQVRDGDWFPVNGMHRASALWILGREVPALLVKE